MAYTTLINDIQAVIKNNGNQEITGQVLQTALVEMVNELGSGYTYKGVATLSTTPDVTTPNIFYLLGAVGTYTNIGGIQHAGGIGIALWNGSAWSYQNVPSATVVETDATPTANSANPVQSGGVYTKLVEIEGGRITYGDKTLSANNQFINASNLYFDLSVPRQTFKYKLTIPSGVSITNYGIYVWEENDTRHGFGPLTPGVEIEFTSHNYNVKKLAVSNLSPDARYTGDFRLEAYDDIAGLLSTKQDLLTFDDTPTSGSNNPVKSKGIKDYADKVVTIPPTTMYPSENGCINYEGNWKVGETYKSRTIPIKQGDFIEIEYPSTNSGALTYGILAGSSRVDGQSPDYATGEAVRTIVVGKTASFFVTATDAKYLNITTVRYGNDVVTNVKINGNDISKDIADNLFSITSGNGTIRYYSEDKVNLNIFAKPKFAQKTNLIYQTVSTAKQTNEQSMTAYNGYLFCFSDNLNVTDDVAIYSIADGSFVSYSSLGLSTRTHNASAQFTDIFYDNGDTYPLLVIFTDLTVVVFRLTQSSDVFTFTKVKEITFDNTINGFNYKFCGAYDLKCHTLLVLTYTKGEWNSGTVGNSTQIIVVNCPDLLNSNNYEVTEDDIIKRIYLPMRVWQDAEVFDGNLFIVTQKDTIINGISGLPTSNKFEIIDINTGYTKTALYPLDEYYEEEGIAVYDGALYISVHNGAATDPSAFKFKVDKYIF